MSAEENKVIARRFIQVWGQGSLDTLDELAASNFSVYYPVLNEPIYGPEAFKQHLMRARSAVPDATIESLDEIAEGDKVVVRWTVHGTHQGVFLGIPPTGQQLTWTGMTIYRIADGKVVEERGEGLGTQPRHLDDRSHDARRKRHARQGVRALPESDASRSARSHRAACCRGVRLSGNDRIRETGTRGKRRAHRVGGDRISERTDIH